MKHRQCRINLKIFLIIFAVAAILFQWIHVSFAAPLELSDEPGRAGLASGPDYCQKQLSQGDLRQQHIPGPLDQAMGVSGNNKVKQYNFYEVLFMIRMRVVFITALLMLCITSTSFAAVNNKYFHADKQYFDAESGQYFISGNIVINLNNGYIAGNKAQVKLSTLEFWGTDGWTLKQYDVTFKGSSAYVVFGKDVAMIEGGADFQRPNLQITSTRVDYNWKTKIAEFKDGVKVVQEGCEPKLLDLVRYNVETNEFVK